MSGPDDRCVICNSVQADASGLCDDHKYDEQLDYSGLDRSFDDWAGMGQ